jgi:F0F1-type ATP synthase assembly protein I
VGDQPDRAGSSGSDMAKGLSQASWGLAVAFGFVGVMLGGWLVGRLVDSLLDIEPWAQVVGAIAGWVGGVFVVYFAAQRRFE